MLREANRPGHVEVAVEYYNDEEQHAFTSGRYPDKIKDVAGSRIQVPIAEFLTYYLFDDKEHAAHPPTIEELRAKISTADQELSKWVEWDGASLRVRDEWRTMNIAVTKKMGDAVALAVANRIHGLSDADWSYIEKSKVKTMDWHFASDGVNHIEVEAKGCFVDDAANLTGLYDAKQHIKEKKKAALEPGYHRPAALRYGTILAIDQNPDSVMHCRLVDPEGSSIQRDPRATRLIHRLRWAASLVATITSRSPFTVAINNRLAALEDLDNPFALAERPLVKGDGSPFNVAPKPGNSGSPFFMYRSTVNGSDYGGIVFPYDPGHLMFLGLHERWLSAVADQDFEQILRMNFPTKTIKAEVSCIMSWRRFNSANLQNRIKPTGNPKTDQNAFFRLPAVIQQSQGGMAFGLVSLP